MSNPFALTTADPRFDPREPVTVNGYLYVPAAEHDRRVTELLEANNRYLERARVAERYFAIIELIQLLTFDEGNSVNILCPNPDFNGQPNYAIECCGDWTGWKPRRFANDDWRECFRLAVIAMKDFSADKPANPGGAHAQELASPPAGPVPGAAFHDPEPTPGADLGDQE